MLAYPTESQKGRYIGVFWTIFNLGGVVGASVSLGQNFHSEANSGEFPSNRNDYVMLIPILSRQWNICELAKVCA